MNNNYADEDIYILKWAEYDELIKNLASKLQEHAHCPELIVAISRGGLIPSVSLSHRLNIRNIGVLDIRRTSSDKYFDLPEEGFSYRGDYLPPLACSCVLLIDDIIGYGHSVVEAKRVLSEKYPGAEIIIVTLFNDDNLSKSEAFNLLSPLYYAKSLTGKKWVKFCWEK